MAVAVKLQETAQEKEQTGRDTLRDCRQNPWSRPMVLPGLREPAKPGDLGEGFASLTFSHIRDTCMLSKLSYQKERPVVK
jgi:hypothetical protein